jgi:hypothetical protein
MIRNYLTPLSAVAFLCAAGVVSAQGPSTRSSTPNTPSVSAPVKATAASKVKHSRKHGKTKKAVPGNAKTSAKK